MDTKNKTIENNIKVLKNIIKAIEEVVNNKKWDKFSNQLIHSLLGVIYNFEENLYKLKDKDSIEKQDLETLLEIFEIWQTKKVDKFEDNLINSLNSLISKFENGYYIIKND